MRQRRRRLEVNQHAAQLHPGAMQPDSVSGRRAAEGGGGLSAGEPFPSPKDQNLSHLLWQVRERPKNGRWAGGTGYRLVMLTSNPSGDRLLASAGTPLRRKNSSRDRVKPWESLAVGNVVEAAPSNHERLRRSVGGVVVGRRAAKRVGEHLRRVFAIDVVKACFICL